MRWLFTASRLQLGWISTYLFVPVQETVSRNQQLWLQTTHIPVKTQWRVMKSVFNLINLKFEV